MVVDGNSDAIVTDDSDLAMYIGSNGRDLLIKDDAIKTQGELNTTCQLCTDRAGDYCQMIEEVLVGA